MTFRYELRRMKTLLEEPRQSNLDNSPTRNYSAEANSKLRLKSEPSRSIKAILTKGNLPKIDSSNKKTSDTINDESPTIKKTEKEIDGKKKERKERLTDESLLARKLKNAYGLKAYGNNKFYYPGNITTFKETSNQNAPVYANRGIMNVQSKDQSRKSPFNGHKETSNKPEYQHARRAINLTFERPSSQDQAKNYGRFSKPQRANHFIKETLSTSVNLSCEGFSLDPSKCSYKKSGVLEAYSANSNKGIVRNYNEDRVSIILNIVQPSHSDYKGDWPNCSFFGIYDGHGGSKCADFLKESLHRFIIGNRNFPENPVEALKEGFKEAEAEFLSLAQRNKQSIESSGSCAIVIIIVNHKCYIANVGDSRAVMSCQKGKNIVALSKDHKPGEESEKQRIIRNGGTVYQNPIGPINGGLEDPETQMGPQRVFPGRLSVSRTFGDIEAKLGKFGGNPLVVIAEPEIQVVSINEQSDFIVMGCDGIFDRLENEDVCSVAWSSIQRKCSSIHEQAALATEAVIMEAIMRQTYDNVTVVMLLFAGFKDSLKFEEELTGQMVKEEEEGKKSDKDKELPLDFYQVLNKKPIAKRSASNPRANPGVSLRDSLESSLEIEKSNTNSSLDEAFTGQSHQQKNTFLGSSRERTSSASKQLVKAYKKLNFYPLAK